MNEARRNALKDICERISAIKSDLEIERDAEQEYFDNMPENMQGGEKGEQAEAVVEALSSAADNLENIISDIEGAI